MRPKRSLAAAFQSRLEEDREGVDAQREAESNADPDYMSDTILAQLSESDVPRAQTYSERRNRVLLVQAERQRNEMQDAEERRAFKKQRGPLDGEREALYRGIHTNLIDRVASPFERVQPGQGSSAAWKMMQAMGYTQGAALGKDASEDAQHVPLAPDTRWMHDPEKGLRRTGLGHLSIQIAAAVESVRNTPAKDSETQADDFRRTKARDAEQKHIETLLQKARGVLRALDEEHGIEYSPLWLDPTALPAGHALYQASFLHANERGEEDAVGLLEHALLGSGAEPETAQRHADAKSFSALPATARLAVTSAHLREAYAYCVFCGHKYDSGELLETECPGDTEDVHE
ncbi:hypothetical protein MVES1_003836 [Malassezia vespertilionis]|uniref:G-patch domain-containing protein n=1 Tax=Malassezia vespertilionis TaxID=2020962 RepID=A0A2N1J7U0_9BASI|nr:uncharacterized protein MVES1_003836 [Malassezia vespertilionis]PKI82625.1 hypothetical protein MVES_003392 [Malassezia vespertilionis]WFD08460.1 hypothetical protein MVES1_003836 [Malassezia vespertilionis]